MMDVPRNATNLIIVSRLVDASNTPITGVAYNDADLALSSLKYGDTAYQSITLVAGTLGTYIANSWVEIGDGDYQFCPANTLIVEGRNTVIKSVYDGNVIYGQINAVAGGGSIYGSGGIEWDDLTVTVGGTPQDGVAVWVSTDSAGNNTVAGTVYTNTNGQLDSPLMLEAGSYYLWLQKSGANFTNPTQITVGS